MFTNSVYKCKVNFIKDNKCVAIRSETFKLTGYGTHNTIDLYHEYDNGDRYFIRNVTLQEFEEHFEKVIL